MAGSAVAGSTSSWVMPGKKLEDGTHYILTGRYVGRQAGS